MDIPKTVLFEKPMLAKSYEGQDPQGWWMSEKLDGIRAIWDGKKLWSRNGNMFYAPAWFTSDLPNHIKLDGELWEGHNLFQRTVGKVRTKKGGDWSGIFFMVFDIVSPKPFEERMITLHNLNLPSHIKVMNQVRCSGHAHLCDFKEDILNNGGEGVMLREAGSFYEHKRSESLLKIKDMQTDEAHVIGYEPGKGRNEGYIGTLLCRYADKIIRIGSGLTDRQRKRPPALNTIVTFSFFELTAAGMPRFPILVEFRNYE